MIFSGDIPSRTMPGGVVLNAAAALGRMYPDAVSFVSEAASDHPGDMVVRYLDESGVNTRAVDRFTDGSTQLRLVFVDPDAPSSRYGSYPRAGCGLVWPRIDPDDIVVFGGYYAIDPRSGSKVYDIVKYARERKAIVVYVPNYEPQRINNVTHVMPALLENMEVADMLLTRNADLDAMFGKDDPARAFKEHVCYHCNLMINGTTEDSAGLTLYHRELTVNIPYMPSCGFASTVAYVVSRLYAGGITHDDMLQPALIGDSLS